MKGKREDRRKEGGEMRKGKGEKIRWVIRIRVKVKGKGKVERETRRKK